MLKEKEQHRETLAAAAKAAFLHFQSEIAQHPELLAVTKQLAVVDCLLSFAQVACLPGYTKPVFVSDNRLTIKGGRHPMVSQVQTRLTVQVEALREDSYVPFDIDFSAETGTAKIITGPNMSGKSSAVRATVSSLLESVNARLLSYAWRKSGVLFPVTLQHWAYMMLLQRESSIPSYALTDCRRMGGARIPLRN